MHFKCSEKCFLSRIHELKGNYNLNVLIDVCVYVCLCFVSRSMNRAPMFHGFTYPMKINSYNNFSVVLEISSTDRKTKITHIDLKKAKNANFWFWDSFASNYFLIAKGLINWKVFSSFITKMELNLYLQSIHNGLESYLHDNPLR